MKSLLASYDSTSYLSFEYVLLIVEQIIMNDEVFVAVGYCYDIV